MGGHNLICCVVNFGDASKVLKIAKKYGARNGNISIGRGTVNSRFLEFLRINEIRKEVVYMLVESELASSAISGISKDMGFDKPNHGIAFSFDVSAMISRRCKGGQNTTSEVKKSMYSAIYVVVDKGRAEDVIEAANKAGARGGTIVNARGAGIHEAQKLFSIEIEPEKEKVFIIARNDMKDAIIESIKAELKIEELGNGIIFVLDVAEAHGLHEE